MELGYHYTSYSEHGAYNIKYWDRDLADFVWQDDLHAPFFYRRQIHSLYAMLTDKVGRFEFDAGLRADHTIDELTISVAGADRYIKRLELFPCHTTPDGATYSPWATPTAPTVRAYGSSNRTSHTRTTTQNR